jgi:hypothetical protein
VAQADILLEQAICAVGLGPDDDPLALFNGQLKIRDALQDMHESSPISVQSTGAITERVCEWALKSSIPDGYTRLGKNEKWIGDFSLLGYPFNAVLSVKSFKAKERLLASGLGIILAPTIGFGWFSDPDEFKNARCQSLRDKAFLAIYMPPETLAGVESAARKFKNANGRPLLRSVLRFPEDLVAVRKQLVFGKVLLDAIEPRHL